MSVKLRFNGLEELRVALRALPEDLRDDALVIVMETGQEAKEEIQASYEASKVTGNLAKGVTSEVVTAGAFGALVKVRSRAQHAHIFETGTQVRRNRKGANRGAMPPGKVFVPIMQRRRRVMYELLTEMVRRAGFQIKGAA